MSVFVPANKQEVRALLKLMDCADYSAHRAATASKRTYKAAVAKLRKQHKELFAREDVRAYHGKQGCAWEKFGLKAQCAIVAEQFKMPIWDVISKANAF